jgi:outer membrane receptor protein involved in Fe transport
MSSGQFRIRFFSVVLFLVNVNIIFAGTTGKIAGRVVDKENGHPLIGVNVLVGGTTVGSITDIDGYYAILLVPPGVRTVIASMVGYAPVTVNEVRVLIDQTSPVNIEMVPKAIETSVVVVVAERNAVKKDVSTSVVAIQSEEISSLPVTSISDVIGLQAGVEEGLLIRGGTSDQNLLQIDGVTQRDPRNNSPIASIALTSIQEVAVEKGGFNAEYGQVQSGVINIVAREGSPTNYFGAAKIQYSPPTPKNFGISVYDPTSMWNKPFLDPAVSWTGTDNGAWDYYTARQYPHFEGWNSVSQRLLKDDDPNNDLSPAAAQRVWEWEHRRRPATDQPDYNIDASFGGPVPFVSSSLGNLRFFTSYILQREMFLIPLTRDDYKEYNWSMKVNADFSKDMKLMLTATTGKYYTSAMNTEENYLNNPSNFGITDGNLPYNPTEYFRSPISIAQMLTDQRDSKIYSDGWYSEAAVDHLTLSAKLTTVITPATYYDISIEHVNRNYLAGQTSPRDTAKIYEVVPGYFVDAAPYGYSSSSANSPISGMFLGGHSGELIDSSIVNSYKVKFDLTSQVNNTNMVKFGVEFNTYDLKLNYKEVVPGYGGLNAVNEKWKPYQFSSYLQDKIEAYGFIANVGLRMDVSNPNTEWVVVDPFDKRYYSSDYSASASYPKQKAEVDVAFSPRLGISHPITENSKLYFNYGHFKQLPAYQEIFRIGRGATGSLSNVGDPNLIQAKTIAYELGYDHVLFNNYLLQIQGYYRDISDVQGYTNYTSGLKGIGYYSATNNNYADIRGVELTFKKSEGDWVRGFVTYTYQVVTNGAFGEAAINDDPAVQRQIDQTTQSLYQQRPVPQPHSRASVTFLTPKDFGPLLLGSRLAADWSLNILGDWRAGAWINYNPNGAAEFQSIPNIQCSDYFNLDLRLNKTFDLNRVNLMVFMEIKNLLNIRRLSGVGFYDGFDQQFYQQSLHLPESSAYDNIPGDDRMGDYRKVTNGTMVAYQPIEQIGSLASLSAANARPQAKYYERASKKYYEVVNGNWSEVSGSAMQKILDDKAYIDMPNDTAVNFLNPRQIFFGLSLSF